MNKTFSSYDVFSSEVRKIYGEKISDDQIKEMTELCVDLCESLNLRDQNELQQYIFEGQDVISRFFHEIRKISRDCDLTRYMLGDSISCTKLLVIIIAAIHNGKRQQIDELLIQGKINEFLLLICEEDKA